MHAIRHLIISLFCLTVAFLPSIGRAAAPDLTPTSSRLVIGQPYTATRLLSYIPGTGPQGQPVIGATISFEGRGCLALTGGNDTNPPGGRGFKIFGSGPEFNGIPVWSSGTVSFLDAGCTLSGFLGYGYYRIPGDPSTLWADGFYFSFGFTFREADQPNKPKNKGPPKCDPCDPCCDTSFVANPINVGTGNKYQAEVDFKAAESAGVGLTRYYNSGDASAGPFGSNWTSNWHRSLGVASGGATVIVREEGGREIVFRKNASGVYVADPDVISRLSVRLNGSGQQIGWRVIRPNDASEDYDRAGKLVFITERNGRVTVLAYDANNRLVRVTGPFGRQLSFAYDAAGRVRQATAPDGGVHSYAYDSRANLISVTYPDGATRGYRYENVAFPSALTGIVDELGVRFATFGYDANGRAISSQHAGGVDRMLVTYNAVGTATITDARNNVHTRGFVTNFGMVKPAAFAGAPVPNVPNQAIAYNARGFVSLRADWNGNVTTYIRDAMGRETSRTEASGTPQARTIRTTWHPTFRLPTRITEPGRVIDFTYDARGNVLRKTVSAAAGTLTRSYAYTYNAKGQVLTATDPRGNVTTYAYFANGDLARITNALGHITSFTNYDGAGRLLRQVNPNRLVTTYAYDPRGRLTSKTEGTLTTSYSYDAAGNLTRVTRPDNSFLAFSYDAAHRLTGVADALGNRIVYTLDKSGNATLERVFDNAGVRKRLRSFTYDASNRLVNSIGAQGQTTALAYDRQGNLASVTDPLGNVGNFAYDALNRLRESRDPNNEATAAAYDVFDHLTSVTDPRGLVTRYGWNGLDDRTIVSSPDTGRTTRTFDAAGNVLTSTDARGIEATYAYDALNRKVRETFPNGVTTTWQYDQGVNGKGRLTRITDPSGSTFYSYDVNGRLIEKIQVVGGLTRTTRYAYDVGGRLARITYPSGRQVSYSYDAAGRVSGLRSGTQPILSGVTYAPFSDVASWTYGNSAGYRRTIDANNRVSAIVMPGHTVAHAFDAANRITGVMDSSRPQKSFGYDTLDRLTSYAGGPQYQTYAYDADGNRVSASLQDGASYASLTYTYATTSNKLSSISGTQIANFTYNAAGSTATVTGAGNSAFTYDARGRLVRSTIGALVWNYAINGLGQRVLKSNPTSATEKTFFAYDEDGRLIGEYGPAGNLVRETVWLGNLPVAIFHTAGTFYIAPDHLGAPSEITNASRQVVWRWDHDPFGNGAPTGSLTYNLRFPGQYYDAETRLNYNYFRDYDPKLGRYIQSDPIGLKGGVNTYVYVGGNPVGLTDPSGLVPPLLCYAANTVIACAANEPCRTTVMACAGTGLSMVFGETGDLPELGTGGAALCNLVGAVPWSDVANTTRNIRNSIRDHVRQILWEISNPSTYSQGRW